MRTTASPRRSACVTPGSASSSLERGVGQRRADRARADHRLDLGRRPVGDDRPVRHQHDPVGVGVGLLEVVGREEDRLARRRRTRASSSRRRGGPRRPSRRSARRARAGRGSLTSAIAKRTRCVCPPESFCVRRSAMSVIPVSSSTSSTSNGVRVERGHHRDELAHREVADQRAGLEHRADRARVDGRLRRPSRTRTRCRRRASSRPSSMSIVVDLPAPFGPSSATVSPGRDRDVDPAHRANRRRSDLVSPFSSIRSARP